MLVTGEWRKALLPALGLCYAGCAWGEARMIDDYHWENVDRVIAVGDLHGDYDQYMKVLRDAGLVNGRGKWTGGEAHLVQTGDIPDRGPSSRAIIDHLAALKKQARRAGGRVHTLIGNHEAMNSYGDLRYVHPGEYEAFKGSRSAAIREQLWEYNLKRIRELKPEQFLVMDLQAYRQEWEKAYPLGWVEHRKAWQPDGEYGRWVLGNPVAVKVNDTIFLHGGLSAKYCRFSLNELTAQAHERLEHYDRQNSGILEDPDGPLWYRGLAMDEEGLLEPLDHVMLDRYSAARIVIGHSPTGGVVWPRFDGRVVVNDTGIASYYGSHDAYLELTANSVAAGYGDQKLALPARSDDREAYLREVIALDPENAVLQRRLARMLEPPTEFVPAQAGEAPPAATETGESDVDPAAVAQPPPAFTADTCRPSVSQ